MYCEVRRQHIEDDDAYRYETATGLPRAKGGREQRFSVGIETDRDIEITLFEHRLEILVGKAKAVGRKLKGDGLGFPGRQCDPGPSFQFQERAGDGRHEVVNEKKYRFFCRDPPLVDGVDFDVDLIRQPEFFRGRAKIFQFDLAEGEPMAERKKRLYEESPRQQRWLQAPFRCRPGNPGLARLLSQSISPEPKTDSS